ncbi:MAG: hypothetical protein LBC52_05115 [Treponema sp.]|jgi:hypothetical protein|nr:hypothetical protein [Treponema sp.]
MRILEFIQNAASILVIIACFAGIIFVIWASLFKIKNHQAAIVASSLICCVIMIPLVISLNHYIKKTVEQTILSEEETKVSKIRAENKARILEKQRLENEVLIAKQTIEIEALNRKNMLLERARLQLQGFQQIAELALTQADFKYNLVRLEPTTPIEKGWNIRAEYYHDEVLVVSSYDINAKFGIDLKEINVVKTDNNSVVVSGIRPKYIGTNKWERNNMIKEIRRVDYKYGELFRTRILDARQDVILADNKEQQFDLEFNRRIKEGLELSFMNDVIIQLAQNFIKIVLAPVYDTVIFDNIFHPDALPLMEYLAKELKENNEEKYNLLQINEQIILNLGSMEEDAAE